MKTYRNTLLIVYKLLGKAQNAVANEVLRVAVNNNYNLTIKPIDKAL